MSKTQTPLNVTDTEKKCKVLIAQPKPEGEKSPYFDFAKKHNIDLHFKPFIQLEGIHAKEFRQQKVNIGSYSAIIFTSRHAIEHFFRLVDEIKLNIDQNIKYFCITEAVALYLQKFILFRKRKVFFGADGTNKAMFDVINKHKENENFLYVCSENQQDNEIVNWLKQNKCDYSLGFMYRSISSDLKDVMKNQQFDIICLFTPSAVKSIFDNFPKYKQKETLIATFGLNTLKAAEEAGLQVDIKAPQPQSPSILTALEHYFVQSKKTAATTKVEEKPAKKAAPSVVKKAAKKASPKKG